MGEALRYTPGVNAEVYGGADTREDFFMVRGFLQNFPFIDGLNTQTFFSVLVPAVETYGLERVEVLRGPASVLYGQAYPGGLVNLVTKKLTEEPLHEISVETGTYGEVGTHFDFSGPVNKDGTLLYRLTGLATSSGTQTAFVQDKRFYTAPALTWKPNADTSFTLLAHYGYRDGGNPSVDLPAVGTLLSNPNGQIDTGFYDRDTNFDTFRRKEESVGWQFEHAFSDNLKVRQNLRYTHTALTEDLIGNAGLEADQRKLDRYAYKAILPAWTRSWWTIRPKRNSIPVRCRIPCCSALITFTPSTIGQNRMRARRRSTCTTRSTARTSCCRMCTTA